MGLTPTQSTKSIAQLMGLTPTRRRLWTPSADGSTPTQSIAEYIVLLMSLTPLRDDCGLTLLMGLTLTQSPAKLASRVSLSLEDDYEPTLLIGLTPTRSTKSVAPLMGIIFTQRRMRTHSADGSYPHSKYYKVRCSADGSHTYSETTVDPLY